MFDQDKMDMLAVMSFIIGMANYGENLTQNDKDDLMNRLDKQTKDILDRVESALEEQNKMLKSIMDRLGLEGV